jgi:hypothetical protein
MESWKEQFDSKFVLRELGDYGEEQFDEDIDAQDVKDFIRTEIIEKLSIDILSTIHDQPTRERVKKQLTQWL